MQQFSLYARSITLGLRAPDGSSGTGSLIEGTEERDVINGSDLDDVINGNGGNDQLLGGAGADTINGGAGNDTVYADSTDLISGGDGTDTLRAHNDTLRVDLTATGFERAYGGAGDDAFDGTGSTANLFMDGGAGNDTLTGGDNRDDLRGGDGDDIIDGGAGNDILQGNAGADTINGGAGNDTVYADSTDLISGGDGTDTLRAHNDTLTVDLTATGFERAYGGAGDDAFDGTGSTANLFMDGGAGNDILTGGDNRDDLRGGDGDDIIDGGAGNDILQGNAGADTINGGAGNDTVYADSTDVISGGDGTDTLRAHNDTLTVDLTATGFERAYGGAGDDAFDGTGSTANLFMDGGAGNDILTGGDNRDDLRGGDGDDIIDGGAGNDILQGNAGADTINGGAGNDTVYADSTDVISGGDGTDTLRAHNDTLTVDLTATGFERAYGGAGDDAFDGTGSTANLFMDGGAGNDTLTGGDNRDDLRGGDGDDLINGGAGNDILQGNAGADTINGGAGNDTVYADSTDVISGGDGTDTLRAHNDMLTVDLTATGFERAYGGAGDDAFDGTGSTANLFMDGGAGNDILTGGDNRDDLRGGAGDDLIDGGAGNDILQGNAGSDTILGGDGNDTIYADQDDLDAGLIDGGAGKDTVRAHNSALDLDMAATNFERAYGHNGNDRFDATNASEGVFQSGGNGNDTLIGSAFRDDLRGGNGDDVINGGAGNDILQGNAGADTINGGDGNDTIYADAADVVSGGAGIDTIRSHNSGLNVDMAATGFERAYGHNWDDRFDGTNSTDRLFLSGGNGNDELIGGSDRDDIRGGNGRDILRGNAGNDVLRGDGGTDMAIYAGNSADYAIVDLGNGRVTVEDLNSADGDEGKDTLYNVERLQFADKIIYLVPNQIPVGGADTLATNEDTAVSISAAHLLANDTDGDLDPLSITSVGNAVNGTVEMVNGMVTFTPDANFHGTASFEYVIDDQFENGTDTVTVTVEVAPVNDAPVAADDDGGTVEPGSSITYNASELLRNDTDIDGDQLSISAVQRGVGGNVVLNPDGTVTFAADAGFTGEAKFTYTVIDGNGGSDTAEVTLNVEQTNLSPITDDDWFSVEKDGTVSFHTSQLLSNDRDPENEGLTVVDVISGEHGVVTLNGTTVTFEAEPGYEGTATFDYIVQDGAGNRSIGYAQVSIGDNPTYHTDASLAWTSAQMVMSKIDSAESGDGSLAVQWHGIGKYENLLRATIQQDGTVSTYKFGDYRYDASYHELFTVNGQIYSAYNQSNTNNTSFGAVNMSNAFWQGSVVSGSHGHVMAYENDLGQTKFLSTYINITGTVIDHVTDQVSATMTDDQTADGDHVYAQGMEHPNSHVMLSDNKRMVVLHPSIPPGPFETTGYLESNNGVFNSFPTYATIYDTETRQTSVQLVDLGVSVNGANSKLFATPDGGFALFIDEWSRAPVLYFYDDTLTMTKDPLYLGEMDRGQSVQEVVILKDGTVVIAMFNYTTASWTMQRFTEDGLRLDTRAIEGQETPHELLALENGDMAVFEIVRYGQRADEVSHEIIGYETDAVKLTGSGTLNGGAMSDQLTGQSGDDVLNGGGYGDILVGGAGADVLNGGSGPDTADYSTSNNGVTVDLQAGTGLGGDAEGDTLISIEQLRGSDTADHLIGSGTDNVIIGQGGDDLIEGGQGADTLKGSEGDDTIHGGSGFDVLYGGTGDDTLYGDSGNDFFILGPDSGDDVIYGGDGHDTVRVNARREELNIYQTSEGMFMDRTTDDMEVARTKLIGVEAVRANDRGTGENPLAEIYLDENGTDGFAAIHSLDAKYHLRSDWGPVLTNIHIRGNSDDYSVSHLRSAAGNSDMHAYLDYVNTENPGEFWLHTVSDDANASLTRLDRDMRLSIVRDGTTTGAEFNSFDVELVGSGTHQLTGLSYFETSSAITADDGNTTYDDERVIRLDNGSFLTYQPQKLDVAGGQGRETFTVVSGDGEQAQVLALVSVQNAETYLTQLDNGNVWVVRSNGGGVQHRMFDPETATMISETIIRNTHPTSFFNPNNDMVEHGLTGDALVLMSESPLPYTKDHNLYVVRPFAQLEKFVVTKHSTNYAMMEDGNMVFLMANSDPEIPYTIRFVDTSANTYIDHGTAAIDPTTTVISPAKPFLQPIDGGVMVVWAAAVNGQYTMYAQKLGLDGEALTGAVPITEPRAYDQYDRTGLVVDQIEVLSDGNIAILYKADFDAFDADLGTRDGYAHYVQVVSQDLTLVGDRVFVNSLGSPYVGGYNGGQKELIATDNGNFSYRAGNEIHDFEVNPGKEIIGSNGDDILHGMKGDDMIFGGAGNDYLRAGEGDDTYRIVEKGGHEIIHNIGQGGDNDRVLFGKNVTVDDLEFTQDGNNLVINIDGEHDSVTLLDWFGGAANQVRRFDFTEGGSISAADATARALADKFTIAAGDFETIGTEFGDSQRDLIEFVSGVDRDDLWFTRSGDNLEIAVAGTGTGVELTGWFAAADHDGTIQVGSATLDVDDVQALVDVMEDHRLPDAGETEIDQDILDLIRTDLDNAWQL